MCTQTQATVQVLILPQLHTSLLRDFRREREREKERLKWNCHDPSVQCFIHFTSACRLFLNTIELANRSLLDNWRTCHFVIWHALYENHSHTFLIQCEIKEVLGAALSVPFVYIQSCVCMNICLFLFLLLCLGAASPLAAYMLTMSYFLYYIFWLAVIVCVVILW